MSLAGLPKQLIERPAAAGEPSPAVNDVLSDVLRRIRLSGSLQFCFMPSGDWQTDPKASLGALAGNGAKPIPFHIVVEGTCWVRVGGQEHILAAGDVVAFPFASSHDLGAGRGGRFVNPIADLPPRPWRETPVLRYGNARPRVRLLCGFLRCDAMTFRPLREALPEVLHVRTRGVPEAAWLRATLAQLASEIDQPRSGGLSVVERLTEITFIELLRHQIITAPPGAVGWLAALAEPSLSRCLALIHDDPGRDWSLSGLAVATGMSRSTLADPFEATLNTSPMRYLREWRLHLARVALGTTARPIAAIAQEAGYGTEAAFSRAFARAYGMPPAAWRHSPGAPSRPADGNWPPLCLVYPP